MARPLDAQYITSDDDRTRYVRLKEEVATRVRWHEDLKPRMVAKQLSQDEWNQVRENNRKLEELDAGINAIVDKYSPYPKP